MEAQPYIKCEELADKVREEQGILKAQDAAEVKGVRKLVKIEDEDGGTSYLAELNGIIILINYAIIISLLFISPLMCNHASCMQMKVCRRESAKTKM